jgi:hypothetical protein
MEARQLLVLIVSLTGPDLHVLLTLFLVINPKHSRV